MRKRNNQVLLRLTKEEYEYFRSQVKISGLKMNTYLLELIKNNPIKERPPQDYARIVYEMSKIGNNVNQLAYNASKTNFTAVEDAQTAVLIMERCWDLVKGLQ